MRFLVDAQMPKKLARFLSAAGHDAIHTLDLPGRNRTPDAIILELLDADPRALITKDDDFLNSHVLEKRPARLLLVSTGNIGTADLLDLFAAHLAAIEQAFDRSCCVEISREFLIEHD